MGGSVDKILLHMRQNPKNVRFKDLCRVCEHYFGSSRQTGGSHRVYKMPYAGDPRINIQEGNNGLARAYQVKQVLGAIERLEKKK